MKSISICHSGGNLSCLKHHSLNRYSANLKVRNSESVKSTPIALKTIYNYLTSFLLNDRRGIATWRFKFFLSLILFSFTSNSYSQERDAKILIRKVIDKFNKVQSYEADVVIDTKIFFLNILPQKAHLSFKQPDIFKVKSTGISLLPKQSFDNIYSVLRKVESYDAFITGTEKLLLGNTVIINVIPNTDTTDLILAKLWVDEQESVIRRVQLTTRTNGTILIEYEHKNYIQYALPDKITFTVDVKRFKIPKAMAADVNSPVKSAEKNKNEKKGKIIVTIKNYKIN